MSSAHLTEMQAQDLAFSKSDQPAELLHHMNTCASCNARIEAYRVIFQELAKQPRPAFEFDLQGLLQASLPAPEGKATGLPLPKMVVILISVFIGLTFYLFRVNLLNLVSTVSLFAMLLIGITSLLMLAIRVYRMFQKHQQQIDSLNFR